MLLRRGICLRSNSLSTKLSIQLNMFLILTLYHTCNINNRFFNYYHRLVCSVVSTTELYTRYFDVKILIIAQFVYISAPIYIKSPVHAHIEMISLIESMLIHEESLICVERAYTRLHVPSVVAYVSCKSECGEEC